MIKFNIPENLNGAELRQELRAAGVDISDERGAVCVEDGELFLDINESDATKAKAIVDAHNGTTIAPEKTIEEKLASVGLSVTDLKNALGL